MVQVREVEVKNFFNIEEKKQEFPEVGLVLVTGTNGVGKTAGSVEAVAWGLYGGVVRSPAPPTVVRRGSPGCLVRVVTDGVTAQRTKNGTKSPALSLEGHPAYENTGKAQEALSECLGIDYTTWRRTHVVTSRDVDTFSTSSDAPRKAYVEAVLGLEVFSAAHALAKAARQQAERNLALAQTARAVAAANLATTTDRLESLRAIVPSQEVLPPLPPAVKAMEAARQALAEHDGRIREKRTELAMTERNIAALAGGTCPTCGQSVAAGEGLEDAIFAQLVLTGEISVLVDARAPLVHTSTTTVKDWQALQIRHAEVARGEKLSVELSKAQEDVFYGGSKLRETLVAEQEAEQELRLAEHTEQVLGPKGFRASALANALRAVSELASHYLAWLEPGVHVVVSGTTTGKGGSTTEAISLEVHGYAAESYGGCSDGQRRRIDLAVTLALSMLSPSKGTIFLDECLDRLDTQGVKSALRFLQHLAEKRCVVLITHNEDLITSVEHVLHLKC